MKITVETREGFVYTVEAPYEDMTATDYVENIFKPLMLIMSFDIDTVNDALRIDED